jgi:hypothetical protein
MAFTFQEQMALADGNQVMIKNDPSGFVLLAIKVGAAAPDLVKLTQAEAIALKNLFTFLTLSRVIDPT